MARAVARRGHEVAIYTTDADGPGRLDVPLDEPVIREQVAIHYIPVQFPAFWATSLPLRAALKQAIRNANVVHIHSLYMFHDLVAGGFCRRFAIPYLLRPHGSLDPYIRQRHRWRKMVMEAWFQNRVLRDAAMLHFTTEEERRLAQPYAHNGRSMVVPNGLDLAEFETLPPAGDFRARHPEIGDRKIILFLGRINFKKGLDALAGAFGQIAAGRDDVSLVIAGPDDGFRSKTETWLEEAGVRQRTIFTGMLTGADKMAAFRDAEMFVLPSYSENFGIAVAETMACGLPVVISDRVNIWHEVEAAGAGRITAPETGAVAASMAFLLDDPEAARRMGENGRALVRSRFQWSEIAIEMERAYATLAADQGKPP